VNVPIDDIIRHHGERVWYAANRFKCGIWDETDLYQEILLRLSKHNFQEQETPCRCGCEEVLAWSGGHINRQLQSIAMDIRRTEMVRLRTQKKKPVTVMERPSDSKPIHLDVHDRELAAWILEMVTEGERRILELIASPDAETIAIAEAERTEALKDRERGALRMFIHGPLTIQNKHIAKRLGISSTTVSNALHQARIYAVWARRWARRA
jgi:DNA-directed RNA polymerase specialized sigma24 family protein